MSWLLFDYAGVLGLPQPELARREIVAAAEASELRLWNAYWTHREAYDEGALTDLEYWTAVGSDAGVSLAPPQVDALTRLDVNSWLNPNSEMLELLESLGGDRINLAVLSNAPFILADAIEALPWLSQIQIKLFSCRLGVAKPKSKCYELLLKCLGAAPGETTLIDDRLDNVEGAQALGMRAVHFTTAGALAEAIPSIAPEGLGRTER